MWRRLDVVLSSIVVVFVLAPGGALAQNPGVLGADLSSRLPATIGGAPIEDPYVSDLHDWRDARYPDESVPEIEALETALAAQGLSLADVVTVSTFFGVDLTGQIRGFGIPGDDPASLEEAIAAVALIGLDDWERTEREIGDHTVTFLTDGPLDSASYSFAVLPDTGVLWVLNAEIAQIIEGLEALLAVAAGTAPGHTSSAPTPQPEIGPEEWRGSMRGTVTWDKGAYHGVATATFNGSWILPELSTISHCDSPCVAYIPAGTIDWRYQSTAPGPPGCSIDVTGSEPAGKTVVTQDQMLFMAPAGTDHLVYWGSGTAFLPPQDCVGWEGMRNASSFLDIPRPNEDDEYADVSTDARPSCARLDWRVEVDAEQLKGTCWRYDESGYEERFDWDMQAVGRR